MNYLWKNYKFIRDIYSKWYDYKYLKWLKFAQRRRLHLTITEDWLEFMIKKYDKK